MNIELLMTEIKDHIESWDYSFETNEGQEVVCEE
jgi:hypothetical protein